MVFQNLSQACLLPNLIGNALILQGYSFIVSERLPISNQAVIGALTDCQNKADPDLQVGLGCLFPKLASPYAGPLLL